jgi:PHS family inorganic phosphate transporter-like MFS transporter
MFLGATAMGLLADGYDMGSIDLVVAIIDKTHADHMEAKHKSIAVSSCLTGVMIGQVAFGFLSDYFGRRVCSLVTAALTMLGALLSACVVHTETFHIVYQLAICRFLLGIGIGGEYPISAAMSAEAYSSPTFQGAMGSPFQLLVVQTFSFKVGGMLTPLVVLALVNMNLELQCVWRLALVFGMIPSIIAFFFRLHMHDTMALEDTRKKISMEYGVRPTQQGSSFWFWQKFPVVLGACIIWFFNNVIGYGMGSFKSLIAEELFGEAASDHMTIRRDAIFALFMTSIPTAAYFFLFFFLGLRCSCRLLQLILFSGLAITYTSVATFVMLSPDRVRPVATLLVLASTLIGLSSIACFNLIPLHVPAVARGTCQGFASAFGKFGANWGAVFMPILVESFGLESAFYGYAVVSILAVMVTLLLTPKEDPDPEEVDRSPSKH